MVDLCANGGASLSSRRYKRQKIKEKKKVTRIVIEVTCFTHKTKLKQHFVVLWGIPGKRKCEALFIQDIRHQIHS